MWDITYLGQRDMRGKMLSTKYVGGCRWGVRCMRQMLYTVQAVCSPYKKKHLFLKRLFYL